MNNVAFIQNLQIRFCLLCFQNYLKMFCFYYTYKILSTVVYMLYVFKYTPFAPL